MAPFLRFLCSSRQQQRFLVKTLLVSKSYCSRSTNNNWCKSAATSSWISSKSSDSASLAISTASATTPPTAEPSLASDPVLSESTSSSSFVPSLSSWGWTVSSTSPTSYVIAVFLAGVASLALATRIALIDGTGTTTFCERATTARSVPQQPKDHERKDSDIPTSESKQDVDTAMLSSYPNDSKEHFILENIAPQAEGTDEEISDQTSQTRSATPLPPNPLADGFSSQTVDELVNEWLQDPSINIRALPDALERQVYRSTVQLTLNAVYRSLASLHGKALLGHELRLRKTSDRSPFEFLSRSHHSTHTIEESVLEQVADRLLQNKAINRPLIPDMVERQLYVNCLKLIFRVLDLLAASLNLTICGHDVFVGLEPAKHQGGAILQDSLNRTTSSLTKLDPEVLREFARQAGVREALSNQSWWQRFWYASQKELLAQLHGSLYGLVLGIVDDILANTSLQLLSENVQVDICQTSEPASPYIPSGGAVVEENLNKANTTGQFLAAFTTGVGVGLATMAALGIGGGGRR
jgi:hypothetical protein